MQRLRTPRLLVLAPGLVVVVLLVSCGGSTYGSTAIGDSTRTASEAPFTSSQDDTGDETEGDGQAGTGGRDDLPQNAGVSGVVYWPDGTPAAGAPLAVYPDGYPFAGRSGGATSTRTDAQGRYSLPGCGCSNLGISLSIPTPQMAGNGCTIPAYSAHRRWTEPISPGEVLDWSLYDMPCVKNYVTPDTLDSTLQLLRQDPQAISSGPWRAARQLLQ